MFTINPKIGREITKYGRFNVKTHCDGVIINTLAAAEALNNSVLYYIIQNKNDYTFIAK